MTSTRFTPDSRSDSPSGSATRPIGVFDSGLGGLTVVHDLRRVLPQESIVYVGDTARVPYGIKSPESIRRYAREITRFLVDHGVKLVLIACNTVSAHALEEVREEAGGIPVIDVLSAGVHAVVGAVGTPSPISSSPSIPFRASWGQGDLNGEGYNRENGEGNGVGNGEGYNRENGEGNGVGNGEGYNRENGDGPGVGVMGTLATVGSGLYERRILERIPTARVHSKACPLLVPLAEEGWIEHPASRLTLQEYLSAFRGRRLDSLILGCTHYPLFRSLIAELLEPEHPGIVLVDSAEAAAVAVRDRLGAGGLAQGAEPGGLACFVTDRPQRFSELAGLFLGTELPDVELIRL